jgi:hypothetical protein
MIPIPSGVRVWIATGHTDMRRGMNGLALQVQQALQRDPHAGDLFAFRGRRENEINLPLGATYRPLAELPEALVGQDIVIGATGRGVSIPRPEDRPPVDRETDFLKLKEHAVLVNASSKTCEFNWDAMKNVATSPMTVRGFGHERKLSNGRTIRVAADGFPVNFYNSESAPAFQMQPILGMLFLGACRLLEIAPALGVNTFSREDQDLIVDLFKRTVGADDQ